MPYWMKVQNKSSKQRQKRWSDGGCQSRGMFGSICQGSSVMLSSSQVKTVFPVEC